MLNVLKKALISLSLPAKTADEPDKARAEKEPNKPEGTLRVRTGILAGPITPFLDWSF